MIPVHQTRFGLPDGNCLTACLASLLELQDVDLPSLMREDDWVGAANRWLRDLGQPWRVLCVRVAPDSIHELDGVLVIASGPGPRGFDHAVVWRDGQLVHDPHPDDGGIASVTDYVLLVPLDPASLVRVPSAPAATADLAGLAAREAASKP